MVLPHVTDGDAMPTIKPVHWVAFTVVGMYFVLLWNRKFFDYFSWMFLMYGIVLIAHAKKYKEIIPWGHGVRSKSVVLYGVVFLFFSYAIWDAMMTD